MGKPTGFIEFDRELPGTKSPQERIKNYQEFYLPFVEQKTQLQAARCMDCGVPFCHHGCPLGNHIPDFNDAVYEGNWKEAIEILLETNNFPEFTGRICPAPCEGSCVLGINKPPVAIEHIEKTITEKAFELGYIQARIPSIRTGKTVAIIGSGPAGLAAADQLNQAGHTVTVYERSAHPGGLLRYGIPDFKLEKSIVERRVELMRQEGIHFVCNANIGLDIPVSQLKAQYDAILLCIGSTVPRDLPIPGRELEGIHFAMDFLTLQNQKNSHEWTKELGEIQANGKHVIIIGGGDTGADCVGTSNRQGAVSVTQLELLGKPPINRSPDNPWPMWPMVLRTSSSHEEGCNRQWSILTKAFVGDDSGHLRAIKTVKIVWNSDKKGFQEVPGTEEELPCELALLAIGFMHPKKKGLLAQLGLELDAKGNIATQSFQTSQAKFFAAGDARRGQSLVVWAISEGREAAKNVDEWLMKQAKIAYTDHSYLAIEK